MTWTYSGDPSSTDKDAVRFQIQDVDNSAQLVQDEEINYALVQETGSSTPGNLAGVLRAGAHVLEALSVRFAAQADRVVGSLQVTYSITAKNFAERAAALRSRAAGMAAPYAGGQSISEKDDARQDSDRVQPMFERGQFSNPWRGPDDGWAPSDGIVIDQ